MQQSNPTGGMDAGPFNPFLGLTIAAAETQLRGLQTYQVEGTRFVTERLHANLEFLRALGCCTDLSAIGECQRAWLGALRDDYAEEWGRLAVTTCALGFVNLAHGMAGWPVRRSDRGPSPRGGPPTRTRLI